MGVSAQRYPIRIGDKSAPLLRVLFGVTREKAWAEVADGVVTARFGWFEFQTPVANVVRWRIEGPWNLDHGHRRSDERPSP